MDLRPIQEPVALRSVDGHLAVATAVTPSAKALRLWVPFEAKKTVFDYVAEAGGARFARSRTEGPYTAVAQVTDSTNARFHYLPKMNLAFPHVAQFTNGELLVVSSRCQRWKDGSHELNAQILDTSGILKSEFCVGDGIEHVVIDRQDRLWVGYFDEGVYGNYGWGFDPIGARGLVCFDREGNRIWEYAAPANTPSISDCYVLNVAEDGVWICSYTDFPIVRIDRDFHMQTWQSDLSGPRQFAVSGKKILAYGGYRERANECWLVHLDDDKAERIARVDLHLPDGLDVKEAVVVGQGSFLHVFIKDSWFGFRVPE